MLGEKPEHVPIRFRRQHVAAVVLAALFGLGCCGPKGLGEVRGDELVLATPLEEEPRGSRPADVAEPVERLHRCEPAAPALHWHPWRRIEARAVWVGEVVGEAAVTHDN